MSTTNDIAQLLPGRSYEVDGRGALSSLTREYQVLRAPGSAPAALEVATVYGLPAVGDAHPNNAELTVQGYRVREDPNGLRWVVEVAYSRTAYTFNPLNKPPRGQAEQERGWDPGDATRDLAADGITGAPLLNAAGDPYESAPQVSIPAPVFRRVWKSNTLPSSYMPLNGTLNAAALTIDGKAVPKHAGRLSVGYRKLYNDPDGYAYEYTATVATCSNLVKLNGSDATDIGWDIAVVEAGLYYISTSGEGEEGGAKVRAMEQDDETKQPRPRATPVLLNADGTLNESGTPVLTRYAAGPEASWGSLLD